VPGVTSLRPSPVAARGTEASIGLYRLRDLPAYRSRPMRHARPTTDRTVRTPRLLVLVFGIFLVLVGITASALVAVTSTA
jgi:hypothetical protein